MALRAGAFEDGLPLLSQLIEREVGIGEHRRAGGHRIGQRADARVRELQELEGGEIVEHPLRRRTLHLGVVDQRAARLFLQRRRTAVELVAADPAPDVPRALSQVIRRCLDPSPADRFATAHDVVSALESVVGELHPPPAPRLNALLSRPAVALTLILILVAAGVAGWRWRTAAARARWAQATAAPEIRRLASHGDFAAAFLLAREGRARTSTTTGWRSTASVPGATPASS